MIEVRHSKKLGVLIITLATSQSLAARLQPLLVRCQQFASIRLSLVLYIQIKLLIYFRASFLIRKAFERALAINIKKKVPRRYFYFSIAQTLVPTLVYNLAANIEACMRTV